VVLVQRALTQFVLAALQNAISETRTDQQPEKQQQVAVVRLAVLSQAAEPAVQFAELPVQRRLPTVVELVRIEPSVLVEVL
jgi:hypothetical protein